MVALLNAHDQQAVTDAIRRAEQHTSGEIVVVIAEQSGDYRSASLVVGIVAGTLCAFVLWSFTTIRSFPELCLVQLALLACIDFLLQESGLILHLVPSAVKIKAATRNARAQFIEHGLHTTRARAAILLFMSKKEQYVELIPDMGIRGKEPPETWQNLADQFLEQARMQSDAAAAFISTIERCAALLEKHFPANKDNPNELPDRMIGAL